MGGETPLFLACRSGSLDCVKILVEEGQVDVRRKDLIGKTSIMVARDCEAKEIVDYLLEKGAEKPSA